MRQRTQGAAPSGPSFVLFWLWPTLTTLEFVVQSGSDASATHVQASGLAWRAVVALVFAIWVGFVIHAVRQQVTGSRLYSLTVAIGVLGLTVLDWGLVGLADGWSLLAPVVYFMIVALGIVGWLRSRSTELSGASN